MRLNAPGILTREAPHISFDFYCRRNPHIGSRHKPGETVDGLRIAGMPQHFENTSVVRSSAPAFAMAATVRPAYARTHKSNIRQWTMGGKPVSYALTWMK
jgi:hypothetical protein